MTTETRSEVVENEWYHVRYSGEIPEIALHSSLFFLMEDPSGPGLILNNEERSYLLEAAKERYREIVIRDILAQNRDTSMYRGVLRTICNWRRFKRFCARHGLEWQSYREELRDRLVTFLKIEIDDVEQGRRQGCINCSPEELEAFSIEIGVDLEVIHGGIANFCRKVP